MKYGNETVELVAAAMWRAESVDAGTPETVALLRTPDAFRYSNNGMRDKWLKFARAAIAAMPPQEVSVQEAAAIAMFNLLDDCDTADDIAKGDNDMFRTLVRQAHAKRFLYAETDGYSVKILSCPRALSEGKA